MDVLIVAIVLVGFTLGVIVGHVLAVRGFTQTLRHMAGLDDRLIVKFVRQWGRSN